jgi:TfoX/Sxy family transcriptional regulator of competence genes
MVQAVDEGILVRANRLISLFRTLGELQNRKSFGGKDLLVTNNFFLEV